MTAQDRVRVGVLISGRGSNMKSLIEAARDPDYPAQIALVIANRPDAKGVELAASMGVPAVVIDHKAYADRESHERAMDAALRQSGVELVALAGYMRILTPFFVGAWKDRLINIHPSLLPHFTGVDTHARAIAAGHDRHGCTVHWVIDDLDAGPIIGQAEVPILPGDDAAALSARVLEVEHRLYPESLAKAALTVRA